MRNRPMACPPEVEAVMMALPYFSKSATKSAKRFGNLSFSGGGGGGDSSGSRPAGWRSGGNRSGDDGFQVYTNRRRGGGYDEPAARGGYDESTGRSSHSGGGYRNSHGGGGGGGYRNSHGGGHGGGHSGGHGGGHSGGHSNYRSSHGDSSREAPRESIRSSAYTSPVVSKPVEAVDTTPKFSSQAVKAAVDTEDRILARVKGKINKIGHSTYDATKVFMQQILDSTEIEFLDELMKFVFMKAATESAFCPLYARLLHELADEFTHIRTVMNKIFQDYTAIFTEVEGVPDVGTEDYKAFVEAQERKKWRRGYSQFVAELVKCGEADKDAFGTLIQKIVLVLETSHNNSEKTLLCEEYIDCLSNMCTSASSILSSSDWAPMIKERLNTLVKKPRSEIPGLTNKGRFALMHLVDFAERGWK